VTVSPFEALGSVKSELYGGSVFDEKGGVFSENLPLLQQQFEQPQEIKPPPFYWPVEFMFVAERIDIIETKDLSFCCVIDLSGAVKPLNKGFCTLDVLSSHGCTLFPDNAVFFFDTNEP